MKASRVIISTVLFTAVAMTVRADSTVPYAFVSGTTISASEMNENFQALKNQIDALQIQVATLEAQVAALQANRALALGDVVAVGDDANGYKTVRFTGVNVQLVNGLDRTDTTNGTGNLIVGYNELGVGGVRSGSHNVIVGSYNNYSSYSGLVTGTNNSILERGAAAIGGDANQALGGGSVVIGGGDNTAYSRSDVVIGGQFNSAEGGFSTVIGGQRNTSAGYRDVVIGGADNVADGGDVFGGSHNTAIWGSTVTGGAYNTASGSHSNVSGGEGCTESRDYGWSVGDTTAGTVGCATGN